MATAVDEKADLEQHKASDQACWTSFVSIALFAVTFLVASAWSVWESPKDGASIRAHSLEYFILCTIGGVLSGLPHTLLTPMDLVKCKVQVGEYNSAAEGYRAIWAESANQSFLLRIPPFFRGWFPTFIGYSLQGALKFGLYEYFKFFYGAMLGPEIAVKHRFVLFLTASATAEVFADVALAPWEAVKIKIQTTRQFPPILNVVIPRVWALEGWAGFYKGLPPLWMRQVPYTMVKFASFEKIVEFIYTVVLPMPKSEVSGLLQLLISIVSGFTAGMLCAFISHPSDSVVSKVNQKNDARFGVMAAVRELGCMGLWRGLVFRMMFVGSITAMQWFIYDSFKVAVGLPTTGGGSPAAAIPAVLQVTNPGK